MYDIILLIIEYGMNKKMLLSIDTTKEPDTLKLGVQYDKR
jgi:hypothetical protein